ncbi:hypothetical protein RGQ13_13910 [Thalassotalea psychrophila]|uniref:Secreted protein n=1 Tax=Thalassotalea psychrophila TaxID=3065647 RepID=A0ABY9TQU9_9GAMM|nr:hypothetical protein RGQ13_13910 [Colwelliaceae bacterium SQ149]
MKRKTGVFLLSLFFVSSVVAISTVNNGEQVQLIADYEQVESSENEDSTDSNIVVAENNEDISNYVTDSAVVLVETKEDKQRLKVQEKQIKRGKQKQLTANLNKQAKQALEQQIASEGKPLKAPDNTDVVIVNAAKSELNLQPSKPTQLASLTTEQQLIQKRKSLNLGAPIPPGTFGGGNGNGGPGAGISAQTASGN